MLNNTYFIKLLPDLVLSHCAILDTYWILCIKYTIYYVRPTY